MLKTNNCEPAKFLTNRLNANVASEKMKNIVPTNATIELCVKDSSIRPTACHSKNTKIIEYIITGIVLVPVWGSNNFKIIIPTIKLGIRNK